MKSMKDLNTVIKMMKKGQYTLKQLGINSEDIRIIGAIGNIVRFHYNPLIKDFVYYITKDESAYIIFSGISKKAKKVRILHISDLHAGSIYFDYEALDKTLRIASRTKTDYVFISGDLQDGKNVYRGQEECLQEHTAAGQNDKVYSIISKYNMCYIAILGNHDASFLKNGGFDPLKYLELRMVNAHKKFTYLNAYEGNIVINGGVFRLVHLAGGMSRSKTYKGQTYLSNVFSSNLNDVELGDSSYNLVSVTAGHFHIRNTFKVAGVDFIMPGNYQHDGDLTKRRGITGKVGGIFTDIIIQDGQIIEETQEILKL